MLWMAGLLFVLIVAAGVGAAAALDALARPHLTAVIMSLAIGVAVGTAAAWHERYDPGGRFLWGTAGGTLASGLLNYLALNIGHALRGRL